MPKKKKPGKFKATAAVKAASRAVLGTPPPVKRAENKKRRGRKDKYGSGLGKLLQDADQS
jgi:hypothetical protein